MRAATLPFKIELRAIEHIARASEETYCYAAKVYVDGKHVADVSNAAWLIGKAMAKDLKRSVLFVTPEQPGLRQISLRQKGQQYLLKTMCDHVKGKYPGAKILNLLPHDVALALYKKHG